MGCPRFPLQEADWKDGEDQVYYMRDFGLEWNSNIIILTELRHDLVESGWTRQKRMPSILFAFGRP